MKSLKKSLVLLVVLSMVLSVVAPVFAFNDAIPEGYEDQVNKIAAMGVIAGDANGNFNAEKDITRAEMAVIICKMTGITESIADANKMTPSKFSDVAVGEWYTGWVNIAVNNGVISGFPDNTFRPNDKLTTNQALTLIVKALGRGAFVDKMGAWPGNYVQDAAKLGITKDMVATGSELANRGNVAIICYNALTVGTWDVTSTTLDGEVRLSTDDSLSAKYFQDFVASRKVDDNGKEGEIKYIKLLEDAVVTATALQNKDLGLQQIVIDADEDTTYGANKFDVITSDTVRTTVAAVIDASKAPRNNKEEATYKDNGAVVAYVPEEVYAEVTSLNNKRVDVMFGKDNEVVMLIVVDDVIEDSYITAFDYDDEEIEIAGETYEFADDAVVTLFGYELTNANQPALDAVEDAIAVMGITDPDKVFNRTVKANIVVDEDGDIEKLDLSMSQDFPAVVEADVVGTSRTLIGMEEDVVKSISSKGVVKGQKANIFEGRKIEDVEEDDEPRVIKDGAIASLEDIEVGDVVTSIYTAKTATETSNGSGIFVADDKTYSLIYVSSNKVEGKISRVKNDAITIDGEVYNTVKGLLADANGDIDDADLYNKLVADPAQANAIDWEKYYNEEVEVYLNHVGEVAAIVATTEATDLTVGILTRNASIRDDSDKDVEYLSVKILTKDGSKTTYKVYNEDKDEDVGLDPKAFLEGTVVVFAADANGVIKTDEFYNLFAPVSDSDATIAKLNKEIEDLDGKKLKLLEVTADYGKYNDKKLNSAYRFTSSTTAFNIATDAAHEELGIIKKGWDSLVNKDDTAATDAKINGKAYMLVDDSTKRVVYYIADVKEYVGRSNNYGLLVDIELDTDADDEEEKIYVATLFVDGEEVKYELGGELKATLKTISSITKSNSTVASEGQFVTYTLSNDKIIEVAAVVAVTTINDDLSAEDYVVGGTESAKYIKPLHKIHTEASVTDILKESLTVRDVIEDDIFFKDDVVIGASETELPELTVDEDGCIIYDFRDGSYEMFEGNVEDLEGLLVYGFAADCEAEYVDIIIILD